ncbi:ATP-binding protein [Micromonospora echinofusca]|uniref:Tetratricopeptide repeat protein n=1 Tax=Micromonospora echinofusca TaxID=47858 RepID=A0ABS3VM89_MICEH|nr:tetratricopeptide repeat protein [Micromonospora echinofusca]MBO4205652.1 tetratricopeptide repeat protein [Micromonospora echinofusca]
MGETGREALVRFVDELRQLRQLAGAPSLNNLVAISTRLQHPLARSTLSDKLNAKSLPDWDFVVAYVDACIAHAEQVGARLPAELTDLTYWDAAHWRLLRAADTARAEDRLASAVHAELGRQSRSAATAPTPAPTGPERVVPRQLPPAVRHFAGRSASLAALDTLLAEPDGAPGTVLISAIGGTAGVGKTSLAVYWAHRVAHRFPDGQLYVNLRGFDPDRPPMGPAEALVGFLEALAVPPERIPVGPAGQVALYRSLLTGRRILVLLDNAHDADQVRPLLPSSPGCLVLVTSRNQMPGLVAAEGAHPLLLDLLGPTEARELLGRRLGTARVAAEPAAVDRIVVASAGLPLALAIVAARAAIHPDFGLTRLADELHAARGSLDGFAGGETAADVRAVLSWSYRSLAPPVAALFRLLGLHPGPDLSVAAAASLAGVPVAEVRPALAALTRANLLTEQSPGRYTLHDLLRVYAVEQSTLTDSAAGRQAATGRLLDHYLHTAYRADLLLSPHRDHIDLPPARPGAILSDLRDRDEAWAWLAAEHRPLLAAVALATAGGPGTHAWQLAWSINTYLDRSGAWQDQSTAQQLALRAAEQVGDRTGQARAHRNRGVACLRLGSFDEAHEHLAQALRLHDALGDHVGAARTELNLGILAERQGRYGQALDHAQRAFDRFASAGHAHGQANALNNIGWYHIQLGDHREAISYCRRALAEHQRIGNRYWQAHAWDSLGYAHHHLGEYAEAVDCYRQALSRWREAGERYYEATTLTHLGDTRHRAGDPGPARTAWRHALDILDQLAHPDAEQVRTRLDAGLPEGA